MIRINLRTVAPAMLVAVKNKLSNPAELMRSIAESAAEEARFNFGKLNSERSRYGHNFYTREGKAKTVAESGSNVAIVRVESYKMAHKLRGGTVRAKNVKMVAIPVTELAKQRGISQSKWRNAPELFLIKSKRGNLLLMSGKTRSELQAHFVLLRSVTHKPRPEVIPEKSRLESAARRGIENAKFLSKIRY